MSYPQTLSERDTLALVLSGCSLARYGDGEFNLCHGRGIPTQPHSPLLEHRLKSLLRSSGDCLIGIPNIQSATPKALFWQKYEASASLLTRRPYASAFISRPDSAPWIDTPIYWAWLESLWMGKDVTLVRGSQRSLTAEDLVGAKVSEVIVPVSDAWADYQEILEHVGTPARALLCCGPTATVLAADLCAKGVHAVDLGHAGLFLRKYRLGQPMVRTEADKVFA